MEYKKTYLDAMDDEEKGGFYAFRKFIPKRIIQKNSRKHLELFQLRRWNYIKDCSKILDVGCGVGNFIRFNPYNVEVWGMDLIKESIERLNKLNIKAKQGDLNKKIPFEKDSFDGLTCFHVFEHILDPSIALSEIKRVVKKNGKIIIAVPNLNFKKFYNDYTHVKPYTRHSLKKLLKDFGFKKVKIVDGSHKSQVISGIFFFFPKIRFSIEAFLGQITPFEIIAIARNAK